MLIRLLCWMIWEASLLSFLLYSLTSKQACKYSFRKGVLFLEYSWRFCALQIPKPMVGHKTHCWCEKWIQLILYRQSLRAKLFSIFKLGKMSLCKDTRGGLNYGVWFRTGFVVVRHVLRRAKMWVWWDGVASLDLLVALFNLLSIVTYSCSPGHINHSHVCSYTQSSDRKYLTTVSLIAWILLKVGHLVLNQ